MTTIAPEKTSEVAVAIKDGLVVAFPSDTSYGLACDPRNLFSYNSLFKIKERPANKQISCIFRDIEQIKLWTKITKWQKEILLKNLPGPFTFLLEPNKNYPIKGQDGAVISIGVRIPYFSFTKALSQLLEFPYTATSANVSGNTPFYDSLAVLTEFENRKYQPGLVVDFGVLPVNPPSTVADLRNDKVTIIRDGTARVSY